MKQKLYYIVEYLILGTWVASFLLIVYAMILIGNMRG